MLHGLLHLAGYDHEADTGEMARREQKLRAKLGLPQGLIERNALDAASKASAESSATFISAAASERRDPQEVRA